MENKKVNDCNTKSKREIERLKERKSSGNVQQVFDWAETTSGCNRSLPPKGERA